MNKLRRFFSALRCLMAQGDIILRPVVWTIHDRAQWNFFLSGESGKKLDHILQNEIIAHALKGDVGFKGYQQAKAMLDFLKISAAVPNDSNSRPVEAQSTNEDANGESVLLDRYSP